MSYHFLGLLTLIQLVGSNVVSAETSSESNVDFSSVCIPCILHAAQQKSVKDTFEGSTNPMVPAAGSTQEGQL